MSQDSGSAHLQESPNRIFRCGKTCFANLHGNYYPPCSIKISSYSSNQCVWNRCIVSRKTSAKLFCHLKWYSAPTYFKLYLTIKFFWINQETELYFLDFTKNETTIFQCRIVHQWMMYPFYWKTADFFSSFQRPHFQLPKFFSKFLNRSRSQESPSLLHLNDIWVQTSLTWF